MDEIRDRNNRLIGMYQYVSANRQEVRDAQGRLRGWYDASSNKTVNAEGYPVGNGDQRSRLI